MHFGAQTGGGGGAPSPGGPPSSSSSTSNLTSAREHAANKRRGLPSAALGLLRRRGQELHSLHHFFQRHSQTPTRAKHPSHNNATIGNFSSSASSSHQTKTGEPSRIEIEGEAEDGSPSTPPQHIVGGGSPQPPPRVRRLPAGPSTSVQLGGPARGQLPSSLSTSGHHHLGLMTSGGGMHARRESFLYRAAEEPYFGASMLGGGGGRPVSRASSVASSDPQ